MKNPSEAHFAPRHLALYLTPDHACSYLRDRMARTLFVDPSARLGTRTYQSLVEQGFRRSGGHVYRPACRTCSACVPVRVPVARFVPNRSQRRTWQRNHEEIRLCVMPARFERPQFDLYQRYLQHRHPEGEMAGDASEDSYRRFLVDDWGGATRFIEMRLDERLVGVAVTDLLELGLSAVYTFFDPSYAERSLGTYAILAQIDLARSMALDFLYLGYWIRESPKMAYKDRFRPIQAWNGETWVQFERGEALRMGVK